MSNPISEVYNEDCMQLMARYPDNYFGLAVCDPPYGIGEDGAKNHSRGKIVKPTLYTAKNWDKQPPSPEYFKELFRVSKNQIVWGANHFISRMPYDSSCWIIWDKVNGETDFADCEMAWTSFGTAVRKFTFMWGGMMQGSSANGGILEGNIRKREKRIHPTQKPIKLYDWVYKNYAKQGMKILDTHLGSGSSRISAYKAGLDFTACELDTEYFNAQETRFKEFVSKYAPADIEPMTKQGQTKLF